MLKKLFLLFIMSCSSFIHPHKICSRKGCINNMASKGVSLIKLDGANVTADTETTAKSTSTAQLSLHFYGPISEDSCLELTQALFSLDKQAKYQKVENPQINPIIELHIQSSGGSLMPAFYVCDVIKQIDTPVHTYVDGFVASAASLISVCGQKRFITKYSSMLIHQLKGATSGKFNEIKDEFSNLGVFMEKVCDIYTENSNLNRSKLEDLLSSDIWLDSKTCLEYGLVDELI